MAKPIIDWPSGQVRMRCAVVGLSIPGLSGTDIYPDLQIAAYACYLTARSVKRKMKLSEGRGLKRYCLKSLKNKGWCRVHLDRPEHYLTFTVRKEIG